MGDGDEWPDQVRAADLGAVRVGELSASKPGGADRTRRHIRAMDDDLCKVDVVAQGEVVLEQDGRQARLHAGDFAFVDLSRPATGPTPGRRGSWRSPSPAGCSRSAATASAA
jgi:AraC-binding-like domain